MKLSRISVFLLCMLLAALAPAQTITANITGTVTDPTGAVVTNAKVTATNADTNVSFNATTNDAGVYRLLFLPVGNYNVAFEGQGFKKSTVGPVRLEVNQIARVDAKLELGDTTQTIEVVAAAAILQTESTTTGDTITSTKLTSLPLNGRNFASLTLLIPGAISTSPGAMNTSSRFQGSGSRPQVNGNREQTNNFMLDGVDVNDSIDNRIGYQPSVDALEEVKVLTGNAAGEFGNVGGATVLMTIKSGTNQFHGNLFEFLRNNKLDANGFFGNRAGTPRGALRRNIFGGTLGGPIKQNTLFFFMDYEGTEQRTSTATGTASVAPAAWRSGDLSDYLRISNQVVRDPATGTTLATRTPFGGNIIPANRITNPVARYLFSHPEIYPLPNRAGTGTLGVGSNYLSVGGAGKVRNHQADVKIDWRPTDKDTISGRWSIGRYENVTSRAILPVFMTGGNDGPTTSAVINWTRAFTPRLVNDARVSFSRIGIDDNVLD
ncbi:MAG: carboxypeptidase regulatory-like domain-containing protein, partial [Bryobacteraceae bacterium]